MNIFVQNVRHGKNKRDLPQWPSETREAIQDQKADQSDRDL